MTLLFFDGFDDLSLPDDVGRRNWQIYNSAYFGLDNGRFGGTCIKCHYSGAYIYRGYPTSLPQQIFIGFAFKIDSGAYSIDTGLIRLYSLSNQIGQLALTQSGALQWLGYSTLPDSDLTGSIISTDTWYYVEIGVLAGDSNDGSVYVQLNGQNIITMESVSTIYYGTVGHSFFRFYGPVNSSYYIYYDDIYVCDNLGTVNNTFLGNVRVTQIKPNGAGNYTQFTPSTGSNYECVNDADWEGTDYNKSGTTDQIDTFTFESASSDLGAIKGIQLCNGSKRYVESDGSKLKYVIRKNSTDYISSAEDITDDVKGATKIYETDPEDSATWTKAKIDESEFGYQSYLP